ncbi:MAG: hypothetical protein J5805_07950 [Bacteroidaceae bacterium]|nr:hypothetical protein [Bacteroidaceae bacterium]
MDTLNVDKNLSKLLKDLHNKENKLSYKAYRNHVLKALETYPNDLYLLTEMSYLEYRLDNFAVAMNYVKRVEEVDPHFCYMLCHKAWMLYDSDAPFQEAYDAWKTVAEMPLEALVSKKYGFDKRWAQSRQTDACFYIANLYMARSEYSEAERYVKLHLERRKRGLWSNFTKKEVDEFLRELSFVDRNHYLRSNVDYGPTMPQHVYKRFDEYIKKLDKYKDKDKICRYYRKYLKKYSGDYYLWIVFSEYCYDYNMPKECLLAAEKANMICDTRDDMLVVYDYGSALFLNGRYDEAMREFEYLLSKSMDYIAYNIHGEGMRYAKRLVRETNEMVELTKKAMSDE